MSLFFPVAGLAVLLLLGTDVFITVFHPEGHGGPLTRRQNGLIWKIWRRVAPGGRQRRDEWLALGGPALAVLTPIIWAVLLVAGFALIYYPWMERFLVSPGTLRSHWAEALYYSGYAAATLGTGDIVPDIPGLRLLSIVEAFSGFALLSSALSYIFAIYRENGRKSTLASELSLRDDAEGSGRVARIGGERDEWLEDVARELLHVTGSHSQYPILHYFRPSDPRSSLAIQLGSLVRLEESRGHDMETPVAERGESPTPGEVLVLGALSRYLEAADRRFVRGGGSKEDGDIEGPPNPMRYGRLLDYLGYS